MAFGFGIADALGHPEVSQYIDPRRNMLLGLAAGLVGGPNWSQGLSSGFQMAAQGGAVDRAAAEKAKADELAAKQTAAARTWFEKNAPQYVPMLDSGMSVGQAWNQYFSGKTTPGDAPATVQEWEYFSKLPPELQSQYLRMKRSTPFLDVGTGYVQPDVINPGMTAGPEIAKDNMTPAYDAAVGGGQGKIDVENRALASSMASKMPGLRSVVSELGELAKTATYTQTGQLFDAIVRETGQMPPEGAVARTKYIAMVDNTVLPLLRDTFGPAFTVKEGESLRATLGSPNVSPLEKQAILEAFIAQKERDLQALQSRLPGAGNVMDSGGVAIPSTKYPGVTITAVP